MTEPKSQAWAIAVQSTRRAHLFYIVVCGFVRHVILRWLRMRTRGAENLDIDGAAVLAPVHRSNLDAPIVAAVARRRRLRALGKESLFKPTPVAWINSALGAIPVRRGEADREAMRGARELLADGEMVIVFPKAHARADQPFRVCSMARRTSPARPECRSFPSASPAPKMPCRLVPSICGGCDRLSLSARRLRRRRGE